MSSPRCLVWALKGHSVSTQPIFGNLLGSPSQILLLAYSLYTLDVGSSKIRIKSEMVTREPLVELTRNILLSRPNHTEPHTTRICILLWTCKKGPHKPDGSSDDMSHIFVCLNSLAFCIPPFHIHPMWWLLRMHVSRWLAWHRYAWPRHAYGTWFSDRTPAPAPWHFATL